MTGRSSRKDSGVTPNTGFPPDLDLLPFKMLHTSVLKVSSQSFLRIHSVNSFNMGKPLSPFVVCRIQTLRDCTKSYLEIIAKLLPLSKSTVSSTYRFEKTQSFTQTHTQRHSFKGNPQALCDVLRYLMLKRTAKNT